MPWNDPQKHECARRDDDRDGPGTGREATLTTDEYRRRAEEATNRVLKDHAPALEWLADK